MYGRCSGCGTVHNQGKSIESCSSCERKRSIEDRKELLQKLRHTGIIKEVNRC